MTTTSPPVVVRDTFPCEVTFEGQVLRPVRVLVARDRVYVYGAEAGRPKLLLDSSWQRDGSTVPEVHAPKNEPAHLLLSEGFVLHVNRAGGCGCGNVLKAVPLSVLLSGAVRGTL
jgi:hypothetical protein